MYTKLVEKVDIKEGQMIEVTDVALVNTATEDGSLANSSLEPKFQPTDVRRLPESATGLTSAYKDWLLENWLKRSSRKTYHLAYTKGDRSRCSGR
jgi:hypothetical protein